MERPLICCLDQVTDPRNLGAVVRSAAGAGATGVVVPAHGASVVTPVVCRASAGAVEHLPVAVVPNLARYLAGRQDRLWPMRPQPTASSGSGTPISRTALRSSSARRGRCPAARPTDVRCDDLDTARAGSRIPQRERRGGRGAVRGEAAANRGRRASINLDWRLRMPEPSLYLFDGSNLSRRAFRDRDELVDLLASFVAARGARGVVVFDGVGTDRGRAASRAMRTRRWSGLQPSTESTSPCSSSPRMQRCAARAARRSGSAAPPRSSPSLEAIVHREEKPSRLGDRVDEQTRASPRAPPSRADQGRGRSAGERPMESHPGTRTRSFRTGSCAKGL